MYEVIKKVSNNMYFTQRKVGKDQYTRYQKAARNQEKGKASKYEHIVVEKTDVIVCMLVSMKELMKINE